MELPSYWIPRPGRRPDEATVKAFDGLMARAMDHGPDRPIDYRLDAPRWQFLCHLADHADIVLHGSGDPDITCFEPRQPADTLDFSNRRAVFAATDGIWPMHFATLNRDRYPAVVTVNACIRLGSADGRLGDPSYFFSISQWALDRRPWRAGTVYLLPSAGFERQPRIAADGTWIHIAQAASPTAVTPLAKLTVRPEDFPFLDSVHGHDDHELNARATADPQGFPWFTGLS
jgi:hypothetical protein